VSQDRRLNYRVTPTIEREVLVDLVMEGIDPVRVVLVDISAGGAGVGLCQEGAPPILAGSRLMVRISSKRMLHPLEIRSQVRHVKTADDMFLYGLAFDDWGDTRMHLAPRLRSLFNEREAVRVEPRADEEVMMTVQLPDTIEAVEGLLRDISVLGVGMWVSVDGEEHLPNGSLVQLVFNLPPSATELQIKASICHQQQVGERARVGLEIVPEQVGRWNGVHREITQYVMSRQIETARVDAERKRVMTSHKRDDDS